MTNSVEKNIKAVIRLCQTLHQRGKTPSVALVKAKSTNTLPLRAILEGIQQWKGDPEQVIADAPEEQHANPSDALAARVDTLESRVSELEAQLTELQTLLHNRSQ